MSNDAHLWAVGFDDVAGADQFRDRMAKLAEQHCLILLDWTVAIRAADGSIRLDGEPILRAKWNGRLANLFASFALGAPPLTRAAVDGYTAGAEAPGCISENFVREVEGLMKPGTSVLFVLGSAQDMDAILEALRGLGGMVLKTNVDLELARLIQSTLAMSNDRQNDPKS
jgi:uncharacterized membrane protein